MQSLGWIFSDLFSLTRPSGGMRLAAPRAGGFPPRWRRASPPLDSDARGILALKATGYNKETIALPL